MADSPNVGPVLDATNTAIAALIDVISRGTTPEMLEAQRILMERIALEGDIVPSRVPAPRNITEIGGYLNLLEAMRAGDVESELIASALGVAGAGYAQAAFEVPPIAFVRVTNDRPAGPAQAAIPIAITLRGDFADAFVAARDVIHAQGCMLPLLSPAARTLPPRTPGTPAAFDDLAVLGRAIDVVPAAILGDPDSDALALARAQGSADPFALVARELDGGTLVAQAAWDAQKCDATSCSIASGNRRYLALAPILAAVGWYPVTPFVAPIDATHRGNGGRYVNTTGLVSGTTRLGDELALLYTRAQIGASAYAPRLAQTWNGTAFG
jgi:hypothetical protein